MICFAYIRGISDVVSYSRTICEGDSGSFTCYGGRKIKITYAHYGRKVFSKCGIGFNTKCGLPSSFEKVSLLRGVLFSLLPLCLNSS